MTSGQLILSDLGTILALDRAAQEAWPGRGGVSIVDAVLTALLLLFFLVILGVMRELVILRREVTALSRYIFDPPEPSYMGRRMPRGLVEKLTRQWRGRAAGDRNHVLVFLSIGCGGCNQLIADIGKAIERGAFFRDDVSFVVVTGADQDDESSVIEKARLVSSTVVLDPGARLTVEAEVRATPTLLAIRTDTLEALRFSVGGGIQWIHDSLRRSERHLLPPPSSLATSPSHAEAS